MDLLNLIWLGMIIFSILVSAKSPGGIGLITQAIVEGSQTSVNLTFGLIGLLSFWSGMMKVAEKSGLIQKVSRALLPIGRVLFPSIPHTDPAMGEILISLSANMFGLGNAATPLGLKAMKSLQRLNNHSPVASDAMCTYLTLQTAGVTIIPSTIIAIRAAHGSSDPVSIVGTSLAATFGSTLIAVFLDAIIRRKVRKQCS
jgi:spore maturation protein A